MDMHTFKTLTVGTTLRGIHNGNILKLVSKRNKDSWRTNQNSHGAPLLITSHNCADYDKLS